MMEAARDEVGELGELAEHLYVGPLARRICFPPSRAPQLGAALPVGC